MRNTLFQNNKSFLFYLMGQAISSLGDGFYLVAFMWLAMKLSGGKGIVLGGIFSTYTLCQIILGFVAGPVADRFNKKGILITVDVIRGLAILVLFFLIQFNAITILHLYIITFFFSAVSPFFYRAEFTMIPQIVEKEMLLRANGILSGSKRFMQVISPPLAGVFISIFGVASCFLFDAFSFFVSILCIIPIAIRSISGGVGALKNKHFFLDFKEGYNLLVRSRFLLTLAIYAMCINFLGGPILPLLPLVAEKTRLGSSGYGFMMGAMSAGLIASSLLVGFIEKLLKVIKIMLFGLIISASAIGLMGLSPISVMIIFAAFMMGVGTNLSNLPIVTLYQKNIPETKIGVVSSFVFTFAQIAMPVSMLLSGFLVDALSLRRVFLGISVIILMGGLIGFVLPGFEEPESKIGFDIQENLQN